MGKAIPSFPKKSPVIIFGAVTAYQFAIIIIYCLFIVTVITLYIIFYIIRKIPKKEIVISELEEPYDDLEVTPEFMNENLDISRSSSSRSSTTQESQNIGNYNFNLMNQGKIYYGLQKMTEFIIKIVLKIPLLSLSIALFVCLILSSFIFIKLEVTSDPVDLWSSPSSEVHKQKLFYDKNFGGFYRTEQIIISLKDQLQNDTNSPKTLIEYEYFKFIDDMVKNISKISGEYKQDSNIKKVTLSDVCLKPLSPEIEECTIFTPMQYFQNNIKHIETFKRWKDHVKTCISSSSLAADYEFFPPIGCLPTFLAPMDPWLIFSSTLTNKTEKLFKNANVIIISISLLNNGDKEKTIPARTWEAEFINFMKKLEHPNLTISFTAERSVEDEVGRESFRDVPIALLSYFIMFIYISMSLGKIPRYYKSIPVDTRIMVAFIGVVFVFISVSSSIGFFSIIGTKLNMITLEVLPFLILAVGTDNYFLFINCYYRHLAENIHKENDKLLTKDLMVEALKEVSPGMIISFVAQVLIFALGAISDIPAVHSFSLFASFALVINFLLFLTAFLSIFYFDSRREANQRPAIFCCFRLGLENIPTVGDLNRYLPGIIRSYIKKVHVNILLNRFIKLAILVIFITYWFFSICAIPSLSIGLDQKIALPSDSYLQEYFDDIFLKLKTGAPIYFVIKEPYAYQIQEFQNKICSKEYCDQDSFINIVYGSSKVPEESRLATASNSWIDTYLSWIKRHRSGNNCCRKLLSEKLHNGTVITYKEPKFCPSNFRKPHKYKCEPCLDHYNYPSAEEFGKFLPWFLSDIPNADYCSLGGKPSFGSSVILNPDFYSEHPTSTIPVLTSSFMAYHTVLTTSDDFVDALSKAQYISKNLSHKIGKEVFPYAVFYVYYDAYLYIVNATLFSLGISSVAILVVVAFMFSFDIRMTIITSLTIILMVVSVMGTMFLLSIELNPVTLVNLVMLLGINVEFVAHVSRGYFSSQFRTRDMKVRDALIETGSSVFSGIAITKFLGVFILAFAHSQIFKRYYFKMYSVAILIGTLHGLIFLPAILSLFGPLKEQDTASLRLSNETSELIPENMITEENVA